jgi:NhaA family Na+:H+ antiporter
VLGKTIGISGATYLVARFTHAELHDDLTWTDVLGLAVLGGIGFTVSLLIGDLAFGAGTESNGHAKIAILVGSLLAGLIATAILGARNRVHRRICAEEAIDSDHDGIPDVHQRND